MSYNSQTLPLSLYIHIPWCIRKCPYCDFNSHELKQGVDAPLERDYLQALLQDFIGQLDFVQGREISSIFVGGGTPSLISAQGYQWLFEQIQQYVVFSENCEITMEANPASIEHAPFKEYQKAGINRLSIGVQSFQDAHLQRLGRIHHANQAKNAILEAKQAGFHRLNVDLMHGLPKQSVEQALADLQMAMDCGATHISWYQLTIEPNTVFFRTQPTLPDEEVLFQIQQQGEQLLKQHGFKQYEVSAWTTEQPSRHNLNYWQFGDYLAIGAGAHGKVSRTDGIYRYQKTRLPKDYLAKIPAEQLQFQAIDAEDLPFEFMMNALRLVEGVPIDYFSQRTGLSIEIIQAKIEQLQQQGLLQQHSERLACTTAKGLQFLNHVLEEFIHV